MTYWALRDKNTKAFFPAGKGNVSYNEFVATVAPRLFMRRQDALCVARWWVKGHTFQTRSQRNDAYDSFTMTTKQVEGRSLENIEIVSIELNVKD